MQAWRALNSVEKEEIREIVVSRVIKQTDDPWKSFGELTMYFQFRVGWSQRVRLVAHIFRTTLNQFAMM